jgi:hypothetical protein
MSSRQRTNTQIERKVKGERKKNTQKRNLE